MDIAVLGAGVIGLTAARCLLAAGHRVRVVARELPAATTSAVAAALWAPYAAEPTQRVTAWALRTHACLAALAADAASCVSMLEARMVWPARVPELEWLTRLAGVRPLARAELPRGYRAGVAFPAPLAEMPGYLRFLAAALPPIEQRTVACLDELAADLVVNASGLGARELVPDPELVPIRGEVVRVARVPGVPCLLDDDGPRGLAYVIPRAHDIVLGGTFEPGVMDLTPRDGEAIRARCLALVPALAGAPVTGAAAGLRPFRAPVRLERAGRVIHCYGHGGSGITVSWGCAEEIAAML